MPYSRNVSRFNRQGCCRRCNCSWIDLNYPSQVAFGQSWWPVPPLLYVAFRLVRFIVFVGWMSYMVLEKISSEDLIWTDLWFIYDPATHLSFLLACYMGVALVTAIIEWCNNNPKDEPNRWYHKLQWAMFNVTSCVTFCVPDYYNGFGCVGPFGILLELFTAAVPYRFFHLWHAYLYFVVYSILVVGYWAAGGERYLRLAVSHMMWFVFFTPVLTSIGVFEFMEFRDEMSEKLLGSSYHHCPCHIHQSEEKLVTN